MSASPAHKRKTERAVRRHNLARSIDLAWSSLRTHLADAVTSKKHPSKSAYANEEWEARCVREYAEIIYTSSVELHELTKKDFPVTVDAMCRPIK